MDDRTCTKCGGTWPAEFFYLTRKRRSRGGIRYDYPRNVCVGCYITSRNNPSVKARTHRKARNSIVHHAQVARLSKKEFTDRYGWDPDRMAGDLSHAMLGSCCYCEVPYSIMGNGLADLTFDVVDTSKSPNYRTNVRICCRTCNSQKSSMSPEAWEVRLLCWKRYREHCQRLSKDPLADLPLFQCL